jgi:hypothetical protein
LPGFRYPRRRPLEDGRRRRRPVSAFWLFLWLILIIIVLGLIFGGYRKGTKDPGTWIPARSAAAAVFDVGSAGSAR